MIHESFGDRQEPPFVQIAPDSKVADVDSVPAETQADAGVIPGNQSANSPTPLIREKGAWEKFRDGEGPYPWHLV